MVAGSGANATGPANVTWMTAAIRIAALAAALTLVAGCSGKSQDAPKQAAVTANVETPATAVTPPTTPAQPPPVRIPPAKPVPSVPIGLPTSTLRVRTESPELYSLGELLFFETRLSADGKFSCATCHAPDKGFADGKVRSQTDTGKPNLRHTPTLFNVAWAKSYYWDGRAADLGSLILANWRGQMGAEPDAVARLLSEDPAYALHAERALNAPLDRDGIVAALRAYVATIYSGASPWDLYESGQATAVSAAAVRGYAVFTDRAQCASCHPPPLFTDDRFYDIGLPRGIDPGRAVATKNSSDEAKFKTPGLRGLMATAPYFHDGSAATLDALLEQKLNSLKPELILSTDERADLRSFLESLSPPPTQYVRPRLTVGAP